jgi:hypothetical protein
LPHLGQVMVMVSTHEMDIRGSTVLKSFCKDSLVAVQNQKTALSSDSSNTEIFPQRPCHAKQLEFLINIW